MDNKAIIKRIEEILESIEAMQGSHCKVDTAKHKLLSLLRDLED